MTVIRCTKLCLTTITLILVYYAPIANLPILFSAPQVLAQTPADRKAEADRLLQQGFEQYQINQSEAALQSWQQALIIYREIKDHEGEGQALVNLGITYKSLGDYTKAIDHHQQSLAITRKIKDRKGEGTALGNLGNAYFALGNYTKAIDYYQQSLTIIREIKDRKSEGNVLMNLEAVYYSLGDYTKAIDYHQQSLTIAREIKDRKGEGSALGNLGLTYFALGDYIKAIDHHQQFLAIAREIKDRKGEGLALNNLGVTYYALGDYTKAIDHHQQFLAIARKIKDPLMEGMALGNLGITYHALGHYTKAIDYHHQRLAIAKEIKHRLGEGQSLGNLGITYYSLGDYTKAIDYHQQSLAIAREIKDRKGEGLALGNLGSAYHALGHYSKAIDHYQQRLAIAREIKDRKGEGLALGNLGLTYYSLGDYTKAIDHYQQCLAIARKIKDPLTEGMALGNLGITYHALGHYTKAINYYQQSLAITRKIKDRKGEGLALNNLGLTFQESGKLSEAEKILRTGIEIWKSIREDLGNNDAYKVSIFEEQTKTYRLLQEVLVAQNKTNEALLISEQGRSRALVDLLNSRLSGKKALPNVDPTLSLLQQIAKQQNATLVEYSIISDDFKIQGKIQGKESELYIWVIKPTGEVAFRKSDLKPLWQKENTTLAKLVTTSRHSIGARGTAFRGIKVTHNPNAPKAKNNLKRLHELLINPIADLLPKNSHDKVIFIPQRSLFLVPFAALQDADGKYLIEKHTILTSPSIQVLDLTRKQRQRIGTQPIQGKDTLIVGNPTMPFLAPKIGETPQQLISLPGAEQEAIAISSLFKTEPLIGNKATESTVVQRLPQTRFIHLATHGIFDDLQGFNSSIALTPSGKDDGLLTASEILDLKLNAELVVLSACDTGRGRLTGDGVIGLSRSLITAGVPSVVVSLWSVPDSPTALLMTQFYQNLQKNSDKALAMRQAMLTTMKTHPNPVDWAAFTLIGEAE